jgi:predicted metalloprotease
VRLLPALLLVLVLAGCGEQDVRDQVEQTRQEVQRRVDRAQAEFEKRRERFGKRIRKVLGDLRQAVPEAQRTSPTVRSRGNHQPETIDRFLTDLLKDIDTYWTRTLKSSGLPEPQIRYDWLAPGTRIQTGCGQPADDRAAFYCPADDTIYVAQQFAADLYNGVARGLPGEEAGIGHAGGDFAVAYVVAHEYGHNLQQELGVFDNRVTEAAEPYELQADCLAGTWANSVYKQGHLEPGDLEEATNAALAVGDFEFGNAQHHGTPEQRRDALLTGYRSGDPSACSRYLPAG